MADEYIERMVQNGAAGSTLSKTSWLLKDLDAPPKSRPINEITPAELLALLTRIEKTGRRYSDR
ncbi:phage integrase central domain-containing protein [Amorphus sp. MBR-141]